jgi:hypothetical protein
MAKLSAWCTKEPPVRRVTCVVLALIRNGLTWSGDGAGPTPMTPFSAWKITSRSIGTKSAMWVGMPMPRLTSQPSGMSRAARSAMPLRSSGENALSAIAVSSQAGTCSTRLTKMPGVTTVSGVISPNATTLRVIAMVRLAAIAITGLKLRALSR